MVRCRWMILCGWMALVVSSASSAQQTLALSDLRPGMEGTGYTVLKGEAVEPFSVEILGFLRNSGPKQNVILGRLSGSGLEESGIIAGMSGSPVYVDGKLVGAVSSGWTFAKTPIVGITPIEDMLNISRDSRAAEGLLLLDRLSERYAFEGLATQTPPAWPADQGGADAAGGLAGSSGFSQLSVPLVFAGFGSQVFSAFKGVFSRMGFLPLQGSQSGGSASPGAPKAGSAMAVELVRGDMSLAAYGTVTVVQEGKLLGFGHPFMSLGDVELPFSSATVETVIPSLYWSFKLCSAGDVLGTLKSDREAGVYGIVGKQPPMITSTVALSRVDSAREETYSFQLADHKRLTPFLLEMALYSIFRNEGVGAGDSTVTLKAGFDLAGGQRILYEDRLAGSEATAVAAYIPSAIASILAGNPFESVKIASVDLEVGVEEKEKTLALESVKLSKTTVRPGEKIRAVLFFKEKFGDPTSRSVDVTIPEKTPQGSLRLLVGAGSDVQAYESRMRPIYPTDLKQLIQWLNALRKNDRFYLVLLREDRGLSMNGSRMTLLPPTVFDALAKSRSSEIMVPVKETVLGEYEVPLDGVATGARMISINVRR